MLKCWLWFSGWHTDPVWRKTASAGDRPSAQGPCRRIQVSFKVQDLQHKQLVDLSGCYQEAAGTEGNGHGDHSQPQGEWTGNKKYSQGWKGKKKSQKIPLWSIQFPWIAFSYLYGLPRCKMFVQPHFTGLVNTFLSTYQNKNCWNKTSCTHKKFFFWGLAFITYSHHYCENMVLTSLCTKILVTEPG